MIAFNPEGLVDHKVKYHKSLTFGEWSFDAKVSFISFEIMGLQFLNRVVIITGASSGIGEALAYEFASLGAKLVLAARNRDTLELVAKKARQLGSPEAIIVQTDVTDEISCRKLIDEAVKAFQQIDILINNAGISMRAIFEEVDLSVLKKLMDVNFWGTVYCTKYALPWLLKSEGSLVGVISVAGHIGLPGRTGYSASKFAVRGFLDTIRVETLKQNLHVLVVAPGFTASNIRFSALTADGKVQGVTPRDEKGMMSAETVAKKIVKGIERRSRSMVLTFIEGKFTVFLSKWWPSLLDRLSFSHMAKEPDSPLKMKK